MQTSGISYFFKGIDAVNNGYKYDYLPDEEKNEFDVVRATYEYNGDIEQENDDINGRKVTLVDNAVRVSHIENTFRTNAPAEWGRLQGQSEKTFKATVITGVIAVLAGVATGIAAVIRVPQALVVAIPVLLIGIAILVVAGRAHGNMKTAKTESEKWINPADAVLDYRREVYSAKTKGFSDIIKDDVRGKYFHSNEVSHLWKNADMGDGTNMKKFFKNNPLERENVDYIYEGRVVSKGIQDLADRYDTLKARYERILEETQDEISEINKKKEKDLDTIEKGGYVKPLLDVKFGNQGHIKFNLPQTKEDVRAEAEKAIDEVRDAEADKLQKEIQPEAQRIIEAFKNSA